MASLEKPKLTDRTFLRLLSWRGKIMGVARVTKNISVIYRKKDCGGCTLKFDYGDGPSYCPLKAGEAVTLRDALNRAINRNEDGDVNST